jgi:hypothetical protein
MLKMTDEEMDLAAIKFYKYYAQANAAPHSFAQWLGVVWATNANTPNAISWNINEQCWDVPNKAAEKIKLLMSPHHHALLKAYEIRNGKS